MKINAGKTRYILLGLIAHEPQTGYSIKQSIEHQFSHFWQESYGQIYPALKALEAEGLSICKDLSSEGGRTQKVYSITPKGMETLQQWLSKEPETEKRRFELLVKLSFGDSTEPDVLLKHLDTFILRNENHLNEIEDYLAFFETQKASASLHSDHTYTMLATLCGKYHYSAMIDWAKEAKIHIAQRKESHL